MRDVTQGGHSKIQMVLDLPPLYKITCIDFLQVRQNVWRQVFTNISSLLINTIVLYLWMSLSREERSKFKHFFRCLVWLPWNHNSDRFYCVNWGSDTRLYHAYVFYGSTCGFTSNKEFIAMQWFNAATLHRGNSVSIWNSIKYRNKQWETLEIKYLCNLFTDLGHSTYFSRFF